MLHVRAPSSQRPILELEKPKVRNVLHRIALTRTRSHAAAEDLVADALVRALDPEDAPWEPGEHL
jgi:DNA-directed RNA polymerase specialized sigma24 family protein